MAVDPQTGNLFYVDEQSNTILVSKSDGSFAKTIKTDNSNAGRNLKINMITIDLEYK